MATFNSPRYRYPMVNKGDTIDEFQCVTFFIPVGWWNKANAMGMFRQMTNEFMWPDDDYGRLIASRWQEGYWLSLENDFMASATEVINNNYVTVTCGCGGDGSTNYIGGVQSGAEQMPSGGHSVEGSETVNLPSSSTEPLPESYAGPAANWAEYNDEKCRKINFMVDRLKAVMHNTVSAAESGLEYSVAGLATAVALAIAEPLFFGEVALIAIVVAPPLVRLLGHFGLDTEELHNAIDDIDSCGLVSAVYEVEAAGQVPAVVESFISSILDGLGVNSRISDWLAWYSTLAINQTTVDWLFNGVGSFMPDSYEPTCDCIQSDRVWTDLWTLSENLQGWYLENQVNANGEWAQFSGNLAPNNNGLEVTFPTDIAYSFDFSFDVLAGEWIVNTNDRLQLLIKYNFLFTTARNYRLTVQFTDSTEQSLEYVTSGDDQWNLGDMPIDASNSGKEVNKLVISSYSTEPDTYFREQGVPTARICAIGIVRP